VSAAAASADYGVVLTGTGDALVVDGEATGRLRDVLRAGRPDARPFFDRGPGYGVLSGGRAAAEVDWL
jgi:N-methylhydantoinase B